MSDTTTHEIDPLDRRARRALRQLAADMGWAGGLQQAHGVNPRTAQRLVAMKIPVPAGLASELAAAAPDTAEMQAHADALREWAAHRSQQRRED